MPFPHRPRVSRETRLLLTTVFLSLAALWVLARIRFPEQPRTPNPVGPLLTQLEPGIAFEDLERVVFESEPKVVSALRVLSVDEGRSIPSLRFRNDAVLAWIETPTAVAITGGTLVAQDPATKLAVLRTSASDLPTIRTWTPQQFDYPRYVLASDVSQGRFSLHPVFVGRLTLTRDAMWSTDVWRMPSYTTVPNGTFIFSTGGSLAGLVIGQPDSPAIVPADTLISYAERLFDQGPKPPGRLGIDVQPLTPQIRAATGRKSGVVVTRVDLPGPAAERIFATDIIEAVGEYTIQTIADWESRVLRLTAGENIILRIWRDGGSEQVKLTAVPPSTPAASPRLGLTMRVVTGAGAQVVFVEEGSVAMRAGLAIDDVLTRIGDIEAPTPAQVTTAFAAAKDRPLLVAVTRGTDHFVAGLVSR